MLKCRFGKVNYQKAVFNKENQANSHLGRFFLVFSHIGTIKNLNIANIITHVTTKESPSNTQLIQSLRLLTA